MSIQIEEAFVRQTSGSTVGNKEAFSTSERFNPSRNDIYQCISMRSVFDYWTSRGVYHAVSKLFSIEIRTGRVQHPRARTRGDFWSLQRYDPSCDLASSAPPNRFDYFLNCCAEPPSRPNDRRQPGADRRRAFWRDATPRCGAANAGSGERERERERAGAERLRARKLSDNAEAGKARELGRSLSVRQASAGLKRHSVHQSARRSRHEASHF